MEAESDGDSVVSDYSDSTTTTQPHSVSFKAIQELYEDQSEFGKMVFTHVLNSSDNSILKQNIVDSLTKKIERSAFKETSKPISIYETLTTEQSDLLDKAYSRFEIRFVGGTNNQHAFAAASRTLEFHTLLAKIHYDSEKDYSAMLTRMDYDVYFTDIGANFPVHLKAQFKNYHCCSPVLDLTDSVRNTNRTTTLLSGMLNDTIRASSELRDVLTVVNGDQEITKTMCSVKSQNCTVTSPFAISLHSSYDMTLREIADTMERKRILSLVGTFIYSDKMLLQIEGKLPELGVTWTYSDDREKILFAFDSDMGTPYVHSVKNYFKFILCRVFRSSTGVLYVVEMLENVMGIQYFKVVKSEKKLNDAILYQRIPFPSLFHMYRIEFEINSYDELAARYSNFFRALFDRPKMEDTENLKHFALKGKVRHYEFGLKHNMEIITDKTGKTSVGFYMPQELVDAGMTWAVGCTEAKFKPIEIFNFLRGHMSKWVIGKDVLQRYADINPIMLLHTAFATYVFAYDHKYKEGLAMQSYIQGLNHDRELVKKSLLEKFFTSSSQQKYIPTDLWGRIDLYLYNNRKSHVNVKRLIMHPVEYVQRKLYFKDKADRTTTVQLEMPDLGGGIFGVDLKSVVKNLVSEAIDSKCVHSEEEKPRPVVKFSDNKTYVMDGTIVKTGDKREWVEINKFSEFQGFVESFQRISCLVPNKGKLYMRFHPELLTSEFLSETPSRPFSLHKVCLKLDDKPTEFYCFDFAGLAVDLREVVNLPSTEEQPYPLISSTNKGTTVCPVTPYLGSSTTLVSFGNVMPVKSPEDPLETTKYELFNGNTTETVEKLYQKLENGYAVTPQTPNRSAVKLKELDEAFQFNLINATKVLDLCAYPGGFATYTTSKLKNVKYDYVSKTTIDNKIRPSFIPKGATDIGGGDFDLLTCDKSSIFKERYYDLVLADGAVTTDYEDVELDNVNLLLSEIEVTMSTLKYGGKFVVKFMGIRTNINRTIAKLLAYSFRDSFLVKPKSSKRTNSEFYFVGLGLKRDLPTEQFVTIQKLVKISTNASDLMWYSDCESGLDSLLQDYFNQLTAWQKFYFGEIVRSLEREEWYGQYDVIWEMYKEEHDCELIDSCIKRFIVHLAKIVGLVITIKDVYIPKGLERYDAFVYEIFTYFFQNGKMVKDQYENILTYVSNTIAFDAKSRETSPYVETESKPPPPSLSSMEFAYKTEKEIVPSVAPSTIISSAGLDNDFDDTSTLENTVVSIVPHQTQEISLESSNSISVKPDSLDNDSEINRPSNSRLWAPQPPRGSSTLDLKTYSFKLPQNMVDSLEKFKRKRVYPLEKSERDRGSLFDTTSDNPTKTSSKSDLSDLVVNEESYKTVESESEILKSEFGSVISSDVIREKEDSVPTSSSSDRKKIENPNCFAKVPYSLGHHLKGFGLDVADGRRAEDVSLTSLVSLLDEKRTSPPRKLKEIDEVIKLSNEDILGVKIETVSIDECNFVTLKSPGDGRCLFWALYHNNDPKPLLKYMKDKLPKNASAALKQEMKDEYGGYDSIAYFVALFGVSVVVVTDNTPLHTKFGVSDRIIYLKYHTDHYDRLVPLCLNCKDQPSLVNFAEIKDKMNFNYDLNNIQSMVTGIDKSKKISLHRLHANCYWCDESYNKYVFTPLKTSMEKQGVKVLDYGVKGAVFIKRDDNAISLTDTLKHIDQHRKTGCDACKTGGKTQHSSVDHSLKSCCKELVGVSKRFVYGQQHKYDYEIQVARAGLDVKLFKREDGVVVINLPSNSNYNSALAKYLLDNYIQTNNMKPNSTINIVSPSDVDLDFMTELFNNNHCVHNRTPAATVNPPIFKTENSDYAVMYNSAEEMKYIWYTTFMTAGNKMRIDYEQAISSLSANRVNRSVIKDTTFGLIDVRAGTMCLAPDSDMRGTCFVYYWDDKRQEHKFVKVEKVFGGKIDYKALRDYVGDVKYVCFSKLTKIMNEQDLYNAACKLSVNKQSTDFRVTIVEGVPGAGKTQYILNNHNTKGLTDVVVTATREAAADLRTRSKCDNHKKYRTIDSLMIHLEDYEHVEVKRLWVDEGLMKHFGIVVMAAVGLNVQELVICGDSAQIPYFNNEGIITTKHAYKDRLKTAKVIYLKESYRMPMDSCAYLSSIKNLEGKLLYPFNIMTYNQTEGSISLEITKAVTAFKLPPGAQILTFTQADKHSIQNTNGRNHVVNTVGEFQGKQAESVVLLRVLDKEIATYNNLNQFVVALSRHTKRFKYVTPVRDDLAKLISKSLDRKTMRKHKIDGRGGGMVYNSSKKNLDRYFPHLTSNEQYLDYTVRLKPEYCKDLNLEMKVLNNIVLNHSFTGYTQVKPKFDCLLELPEYVPKPVLVHTDNEINTIQDFINRIYPGSTDDHRHENYIFENDPLYVTATGFTISKCLPPPVIRDYFSPTLRTSCPVAMAHSQKQIVKAFNERNGGVPDMAGRIPEYYYADKMIKSFKRAYVADHDLLKVYTENPIQINVDSITDWLTTQPTEVLNVMEKEVDFTIFDKKLNEYFYMLKRNSKPVLDPNPHTKLPSPQAIAFQEKLINAVFCPLVKDMKARLISIMKKDKMIYCDMSPDTFQHILNYRFPLESVEQYKYRAEIDFSKYDKSQGLLALQFETQIMKELGVPTELILVWVLMHRSSTLISLEHKFKAKVVYQRKSGDAMTFLGNTMFLMAVIATAIDAIDPKWVRKQRKVFGVYAGDDSYLWMTQDFDREKFLKFCTVVFNMEVKLLNFKFPYFCSKFIVPYDNQWYVVPDLAKMCVKLGRKDLVSWEHIEEYRISTLDNLKVYNDAYAVEMFGWAVADRYKLKFNPFFVFLSVYNLCADREKFKNLYYIHENDRPYNPTTLPSLDM